MNTASLAPRVETLAAKVQAMEDEIAALTAERDVLNEHDPRGCTRGSLPEVG